MDAIAVVVFTISKRIHIHFQYYNPPHVREEARQYIKGAQEKLRKALSE